VSRSRQLWIAFFAVVFGLSALAASVYLLMAYVLPNGGQL
jgi:hypothetical protein